MYYLRHIKFVVQHRQLIDPDIACSMRILTVTKETMCYELGNGTTDLSFSKQKLYIVQRH